MPKKEIERQATDLRMRVEGKRKNRLKAKDVADEIAEFLDLGVIWEPIPDDRQGMVAAMIWPLERIIVINEDIRKLQLKEEQKDGFIQSTIAHEIGHWMLHINRDAVGNIEAVNDGSKEIFESSLSRGIVKNLDKIEWQAQYFAGCLLMPRYKLEEARKGRDLTNRKHLRAMAHELGVTESNLKCRLRIDLKWIDIPKDSNQIYRGKAAPN